MPSVELRWSREPCRCLNCVLEFALLAPIPAELLARGLPLCLNTEQRAKFKVKVQGGEGIGL
jgi:hypothetical protein